MARVVFTGLQNIECFLCSQSQVMSEKKLQLDRAEPAKETSVSDRSGKAF